MTYILPERSQPEPQCGNCYKHPDDIPEYVEAAAVENIPPAAYVRYEEGTYNHENGHFLCTPCYVVAGMPSNPRGWVCP